MLRYGTKQSAFPSASEKVAKWDKPEKQRNSIAWATKLFHSVIWAAEKLASAN